MNRTKIEDTTHRRPFSIPWLPFLFLTLAAATGVAGPTNVPHPDTLTLDVCLSIARVNSPELHMAEQDIEAARLDRQLVDRSRWPELRLVGGVGYAPASLDFGYDPAVSNGGEMGARIAAEQNVYSGGIHGLQARQADNETGLRTISRKQQDRDLTYAVRQTFIELLAANRIRDLHRRSVQRLSDYSDLITSLNQSGAAGYADLLNTQVEMNRAKIDMTTAQDAVTGARLNLERLLGIPDDTALIVAGSLDSLLTDASDTTTDGPGILPEDNLDLGAARLNLSQSQVDLSLTREQWKPTVSITADAGVLTSRENLLLPDAERYNSTGYSVGLALEMPLWDWGRRKRELAKNRLRVRSAEDNVALVRRDLQAEYHDTSLRLRSARRRLASIRTVVQTAEKSFLLNKAQYAGGTGSVSDVLLAQQAFTETQRSAVEALAEIQSLEARRLQLTQSERETAP